jgi:hypothetical protein
VDSETQINAKSVLTLNTNLALMGHSTRIAVMPHPLPCLVNCAVGAAPVPFLNQILFAIVWVAEMAR